MPCDLRTQHQAEARDQAFDQPQIARGEIGKIELADAAAERRLGAGRVSRRVEQRNELRMDVGRRGRVVDGEKIDAHAVFGLECDHQAEEIRIGLQMRAAKAGGDAADAGPLRARLEQPDTGKIQRQVLRDAQHHLAAGDLILMRHPVRHGEAGMVGDEFLLDRCNRSDVVADACEVGRAWPKRGRHDPALRLLQLLVARMLITNYKCGAFEGLAINHNLALSPQRH